MAKCELKLPKMGESVAEATINSWLKEIGDRVEIDESVVEISTDKVDSDVPSEVSGILVEKLFDIDKVVEVGQTIAIIETEQDVNAETPKEAPKVEEQTVPVAEIIADVQETVATAKSLTTPISSQHLPMRTNFILLW